MFLIFQWQWRIRIVNLECIMICKWHFAKFIFATNSRHKKSRKWFFICVVTQQFLSLPFLIIYHNRQKFFLLQKFNLTEFFVAVGWVYSVLTFQLDKLVKMSNNKNNRWIFWAPLDDAAKQKAHILVEMDARVSIYGAIIYKILQSGVYFRTLFILAHKVLCKKNLIY